MRIVFLGNNRVGHQILRWLKASGEDIVALVVHPPGKQKFGSEIVAEAGLDASKVLFAPQLAAPETREAIQRLKPNLAISVFFGYILKREFLDLFPRGVINLHPALLPFNRGAYPNVWSIIEGTPVGATLHYLDEGVDTGNIIAQRELKVQAADTGATLYHKLEDVCIELFKESWPAFKEGKLARQPQPTQGTSHRVSDVQGIDQIDLDRHYTARELINLLRARTFPPHPGAYFMDGGRKIHLELKLTEEEISKRPEHG
jgi:methionyl-tRNA formyltransferase